MGRYIKVWVFKVRGKNVRRSDLFYITPGVKVISTRFVSYTLSPLYLLYKPLKRQSNSSFAASSLQQRSLPAPLLCVVGKYVVHCIFFPDTQTLSLSLCLSDFNFRVDKRLNKDKNIYPNLPESVGKS